MDKTNGNYQKNENKDIPRLESDEPIKVDIDFQAVSKRRRRYPFFLLLLLLLLFAIVGTFIFKKSQQERADFEPNIDASLEGENTWQGAFASKEIFELCREISVSVIAEGRRCSGFVYSSDGWIATVEGIVNENVKGKIEVVLFDGRSFFVESFRQNRESGITLMKINANNLKAANIDGKGEVFAGEELFTFCTVGDTVEGGSLFSGKVAHTQRTVEIYRSDGTKRKLKLFQIGILLTEEGVGGPLFNEKGEIVGIACASGGKIDERYMVDYAYSFSNIKSLLSTMKDAKRAEDDDLFCIIVE